MIETLRFGQEYNKAMRQVGATDEIIELFRNKYTPELSYRLLCEQLVSGNDNSASALIPYDRDHIHFDSPIQFRFLDESGLSINNPKLKFTHIDNEHTPYVTIFPWLRLYCAQLDGASEANGNQMYRMPLVPVFGDELLAYASSRSDSLRLYRSYIDSIAWLQSPYRQSKLAEETWLRGNSPFLFHVPNQWLYDTLPEQSESQCLPMHMNEFLRHISGAIKSYERGTAPLFSNESLLSTLQPVLDAVYPQNTFLYAEVDNQQFEQYTPYDVLHFLALWHAQETKAPIAQIIREADAASIRALKFVQSLGIPVENRDFWNQFLTLMRSAFVSWPASTLLEESLIFPDMNEQARWIALNGDIPWI